MARVLVVEDTEDIASLIRHSLLREGLKVDVVTDGTGALVAIAIDPPDLVVLDLMLPDISGVDVCRKIRGMDEDHGRPPTPILMLTALSSVSDRVTGLEAGADDYLMKPFAVAELVARVRVILRRRRAETPSAVSSEVLAYGDLNVEIGSRIVRRGDRTVFLTSREFEVLVFLLRHANQVIPRETLLRRIWGTDFFGDSNVVAVTIASVRRALETAGESRLIQTIRGAGYVLRHQE
ncbi:MAG: response regulator transcription factor [Chloroflexia bacterium]|nr:response regulator transcription factor [Chloroflexia bacterium]